ncbi:acyl carrier protein [Nonomuraea angiospora]|uniref:acyl carrier protein n=1 Tax=Nonomuraea angiospora TaxID=46172 RepID=UPI0029BBD599|nr:acyl carrier protein [Nonomuraea angiospora]MDX3103780.1 acyl carrier protein [Nonomuraea angiospora]
MDDLLPQIKSMLAEALGDGWAAEELGDDADIIRELGMDSIQLINFLFMVEDKFDVELDFDRLDIEGLYSIRAFCGFVLAHVNALA